MIGEIIGSSVILPHKLIQIKTVYNLTEQKKTERKDDKRTTSLLQRVHYAHSPHIARSSKKGFSGSGWDI